jgi:hypothetical protein
MDHTPLWKIGIERLLLPSFCFVKAHEREMAQSLDRSFMFEPPRTVHLLDHRGHNILTQTPERLMGFAEFMHTYADV